MSYSDLFLDRIVDYIPVLLSLTVHEWAHAWTAWKLGDDTAKMLGRVSLNPLDHIDPLGTVVLPLLGIPFGWAKPVPIEPTRFRRDVNMWMGVMLTAAAGPISNLILAAAAFASLIAVTEFADPKLPGGMDPDLFASVSRFLQVLVIINIALALFNLLPIPPLDGSRIVDSLAPASLQPLWIRFKSMGPILLAVLILTPVLAGVSLLSVPLRWVAELLSDVTRY